MTVVDCVLGVPVDSVGKPGGTELAPDAVRQTGLAQRLGIEDLGDIPVSIRGTERDPTSGILAYPAVVETVRGVRAELAAHFAQGRRPLVLGGCCAILPGILAGLADATDGPVGLAYIDGHIDLYDGRTSPTGEAADMPLAHALGYGDPVIAGAGPRTPMVQPDALALLGFRDLAEATADGSRLPEDLPGDPLVADAPTLLAADPAAFGASAAERLSGRCAAYHLNIDVDVLSTEAFPATPVEYYQPGGLSMDYLVALARPIAADPACRSVAVTCYDPELDSDTQQWAGALADALYLILGES
jgi:arginase